MKLPTLTALSWEGELPRLGEYLMSERGRTAFKVVEIRRPRKPDAKYVARFGVERTARAAIPADAVVHGWSWGDRG